jgi:hypothetical protein
LKGVAFVVVAGMVGWAIGNFLPPLLDDPLTRNLQLFGAAAASGGAILWLALNVRQLSWVVVGVVLMAALAIMASGQMMFSRIADGEPGSDRVWRLYLASALIFTPLGLMIQALGLKVTGGGPPPG